LRGYFDRESTLVLLVRQRSERFAEFHQIEVRPHHSQRFLVNLIKQVSGNFNAPELPPSDKVGGSHEKHDHQETRSQSRAYVEAPEMLGRA
jgi:hypothetical protein